MILYPSKDEIIDAVTRSANIIPVALRGFKCVMGKFGPLYYPGGFCLVFKIVRGNEYKALRVWYASVDDIQGRIRGLSNFLLNKEKEMPFIVHFSFYEKGLCVPTTDKVAYLDIMVMDWIEGIDLKSFVKQSISRNNLNDINIVAGNLISVFNAMHDQMVSHGDLQHTNILVQADLSIKLIDYDSFYYPGTSYLSHTTAGYLEYQHPSRCYSKSADEKTDYFSELIIYMALLSYVEDPSLWNRYSIDSIDNSILFVKEDYNNISNSKLFNEISQKNDALYDLCEILKLYLTFDSIHKLTPFVQVSHITKWTTNESNYCINCGIQFTSSTDIYCTSCGVKRL